MSWLDEYEPEPPTCGGTRWHECTLIHSYCGGANPECNVRECDGCDDCEPLCESCEMHVDAEHVALRPCVIDGCSSTSTVHVAGFPDCVDRCAEHHAQLGVDDDRRVQ
jgi:hypothetical protein